MSMDIFHTERLTEAERHRLLDQRERTREHIANQLRALLLVYGLRAVQEGWVLAVLTEKLSPAERAARNILEIPQKEGAPDAKCQ